jgi:hypothetical protein
MPVYLKELKIKSQKKPFDFYLDGKDKKPFLFCTNFEENKFSAPFERMITELMTNLMLNELNTPILQFTFVKWAVFTNLAAQ